MRKKIEFLYFMKPNQIIENKIFLKDQKMVFFNENWANLKTSEYQRKILNSLDSRQIDIIFSIWNELFDFPVFLSDNNEIFKIINKKPKTLRFYDLFLLDIIKSYLFNVGNKLFIPVSKDLINNNEPMDIYNLSFHLSELENKPIKFITNDLDWASIFTENIKDLDSGKDKIFNTSEFFWVESVFDLFSYQIISPKLKFRKAGSSNKIFDILSKNPNHKAIVDRDGFSKKNILFLKEKYQIYFTKTAECENIWLTEIMLNKIKKISFDDFNFDNFKYDVINRAEENLKNVIIRFKNRQNYLMYNYIPYLTDEEIILFENKCINHINSKNYNKILNWFDNKALFDLYLKSLNIQDLNHWKHIIQKNKEVFSEELFNFII